MRRYHNVFIRHRSERDEERGDRERGGEEVSLLLIAQLHTSGPKVSKCVCHDQVGNCHTNYKIRTYNVIHKERDGDRKLVAEVND